MYVVIVVVLKLLMLICWSYHISFVVILLVINLVSSLVPVFIEILCPGSICHLIGHVIVMQSTCTLKKDGCFLTTEWLATLVAWHIRG